MAGGENITKRIIEKAREQAEELEQNAKKNAQEQQQQAITQAQQQAEKMLQANRAQMEEQEKRVMTVANLDLRKMVLSAKREVLDEAYEKAQQTLAIMDDEEYTQVYLNIVLRAISNGDEGICPSIKDKDRLGAGFVESINEQLKAKDKTAQVKLLQPREEIDGGCIVQAGGMEIDCSHTAVIRTLREDSEAQVAKMLFAGEEE